MNENFEELTEYIKKLEGYSLPNYENLPVIPLYMEQVVSYVTESLAPLYRGESPILTAFMVNNYVKAKIIIPPTHKKYSRDHLAYLMSISLLKSVVSMKNVALLLELDDLFTTDKQKLYSYFKAMEDEVVKNEAHKTRARMEAIEKASKKKKGQDANRDQLLNLAYMALRMYVESETTKLIADSIMENISKEVSPKKSNIDFKAEKKLEKKKLENEAKKLANRK